MNGNLATVQNLKQTPFESPLKPEILFLFIHCKPSSLLKDTERLNNMQIVDTQTD